MATNSPVIRLQTLKNQPPKKDFPDGIGDVSEPGKKFGLDAAEVESTQPFGIGDRR
jgi:hypothetical protein